MKFSSETELAKSIIKYLEDLQWDVYQEVQPFSYGDVADIVAVQGKILWVIECKLSLSIGVIYQAYRWIGNVHKVSVAIPSSSRNNERDRAFAKIIMKNFGVGCLTATNHGNCVDTYERVPPHFFRKARSSAIISKLNEQHKVFAEAGNPGGRRWTPFQDTCRKVYDVVSRSPGICMKDLVDTVDTHYNCKSTARQCLAKWIEAGKVKGVEMRREGKFIRLFTDKEGIK